MQTRVLNIDARYWEHQQESSCEQQHTQHQNPPKATTSSVSNTRMSNPRPTPCSDTHSEQELNKAKDSKPSTPCVDLSGKLDSRGKLTQQEQQRRIDKNLCSFCGGPGHRTDNCPVKSTKGHAATTEPIPTPSKPKESGVEPKKD